MPSQPAPGRSSAGRHAASTRLAAARSFAASFLETRKTWGAPYWQHRVEAHALQRRPPRLERRRAQCGRGTWRTSRSRKAVNSSHPGEGSILWVRLQNPCAPTLALSFLECMDESWASITHRHVASECACTTARTLHYYYYYWYTLRQLCRAARALLQQHQSSVAEQSSNTQQPFRKQRSLQDELSRRVLFGVRGPAGVVGDGRVRPLGDVQQVREPLALRAQGQAVHDVQARPGACVRHALRRRLHAEARAGAVCRSRGAAAPLQRPRVGQPAKGRRAAATATVPRWWWWWCWCVPATHTQPHPLRAAWTPPLCTQARASRGELYHLPEINGFFDDPLHFQAIKCVQRWARRHPRRRQRRHRTQRLTCKPGRREQRQGGSWASWRCGAERLGVSRAATARLTLPGRRSKQSEDVARCRCALLVLVLGRRGLVGYTHPYITDKCKEAGREPPIFTSVHGMKKFVESNYKLHFCDLCIQGRKVRGGAAGQQRQRSLLASSSSSSSPSGVGLASAPSSAAQDVVEGRRRWWHVRVDPVLRSPPLVSGVPVRAAAVRQGWAGPAPAHRRRDGPPRRHLVQGAQEHAPRAGITLTLPLGGGREGSIASGACRRSTEQLAKSSSPHSLLRAAGCVGSFAGSSAAPLRTHLVRCTLLPAARAQGHPLCKFCRKRFYDSNELYRHMESDHEHCFLCRREQPSQYVYFRHYAELEGAPCLRRTTRASSLAWPLRALRCTHTHLRTPPRTQQGFPSAAVPPPAGGVERGASATCLLPPRLPCRALQLGAPPVPSPGVPGQEVRGVCV